MPSPALSFQDKHADAQVSKNICLHPCTYADGNSYKLILEQEKYRVQSSMHESKNWIQGSSIKIRFKEQHGMEESHHSKRKLS